MITAESYLFLKINKISTCIRISYTLNRICMRYYYFNPLSKKCYFPAGFQKYPLFESFYQPYKFSANVLWKLWRNLPFFRYIFSTDEPEKVLPIDQIKEYVTPNSILAFNLGTIGVEQKITVLGIDEMTKSSFFIKYATSEIACKNVTNEGLVLQQLSHLSFVPRLYMNSKENNEFSLIKTSVLKGEKVTQRPVDGHTLELLYSLAEQKIKSSRNYSSGLRCSFAHGDFCPWNMLISDGNLKVYDWELAGQYPLGYDLFTYLFQYEFLVEEKTRFESILNENSKVIQEYFRHFKISDWLPYLKEFARLKYMFEKEKNNYDLIDSYLQMKVYLKTP